MVDIGQLVAIFGTGAAGCLSMAKLLQTLERRRNLKTAHGETDDEEAEQSIRELFPNGERRQVIRAINDLKRENEARREEYQTILGHVARIASHLKIVL